MIEEIQLSAEFLWLHVLLSYRSKWEKTTFGSISYTCALTFIQSNMWNIAFCYISCTVCVAKTYHWTSRKFSHPNSLLSTCTSVLSLKMIEEIQLSAKFPYMYFWASAKFLYHTHFSPIICNDQGFSAFIFSLPLALILSLKKW